MRRRRPSTMITAWEATTCPPFSRRWRRAGRCSTTYLSRLACEARVRQYCWIHDVDRPARREGEDLVEDVGELKLPLIARDVAEMRRADDVLHRKQRMLGVQHPLVLVDIHRRLPRPPRLSRRAERAFSHQAGPPRL